MQEEVEHLVLVQDVRRFTRKSSETAIKNLTGESICCSQKISVWTSSHDVVWLMCSVLCVVIWKRNEFTDGSRVHI